MAGLAISSGILGAGTVQVYKGKGIISAITAISDSTNVATVVVYDNNAGDTSGIVLAKVNATVNTGSNSAALATPIRCDLGITAVISGAGTPQAIFTTEHKYVTIYPPI